MPNYPGIKMTAAIFAVLLIAAPASAKEETEARRLDEIAQRGAEVMPFDLEKTLHIFSKTSRGGLQQVVAKDASDSEQIGLIRRHLSRIARDFRDGNFSAPTRIHGEGMPGLAELKAAKPGQIRIEYRERADGAQISYATASPRLAAAIHQWFDAQLRDHARHAAEEGHQQHHPQGGTPHEDTKNSLQ